jgi:class 3 adenylate cyclase
MRVGVNSGQVIVGEIGSGPMGYTAIGDQVGMAQRMESVAPPGGVMLSESTARLVEDAAVLGDAELVHIKGVDDPVLAEHRPAQTVGSRHRGSYRIDPRALSEQLGEDLSRLLVFDRRRGFYLHELRPLGDELQYLLGIRRLDYNTALAVRAEPTTH